MDSVVSPQETAERAARLAIMIDDLVCDAIVGNSIMAIFQMSQSKCEGINRTMKQQQDRHDTDSQMYITVQGKIYVVDEEIALPEDKLCDLATNSKCKQEANMDLGFIAICSRDQHHNGQSRSSSPNKHRSNESSPDHVHSPGSSSPPTVYSPPSVEGVISPVARLSSCL
jgi:hypothetical protein